MYRKKIFCHGSFRRVVQHVGQGGDQRVVVQLLRLARLCAAGSVRAALNFCWPLHGPVRLVWLSARRNGHVAPQQGRLHRLRAHDVVEDHGELDPVDLLVSEDLLPELLLEVDVLDVLALDGLHDEADHRLLLGLRYLRAAAPSEVGLDVPVVQLVPGDVYRVRHLIPVDLGLLHELVQQLVVLEQLSRALVWVDRAHEGGESRDHLQLFSLIALVHQ